MSKRHVLLIIGVVLLAITLALGVVFAAGGSDDSSHPVLAVLSLFFDVEYDDILMLVEGDVGLGVIARAFLTAHSSQDALTPQQVLDMRLGGVGWGEIAKEYDIDPGGRGLGSIMRQANEDPADGEPADGEPADEEPADEEPPDEEPEDEELADDAPHPVAQRIAENFDVPYDDIIALHESGIGFGVMARAYQTAQMSEGELTFEEVLALHESGMGWGQISREYGIQPGGNGLGSIMRNSNDDDSEDSGSAPGNSGNAPGRNRDDKDKDKENRGKP